MVETKSPEQATKNWEDAVPRVASKYREGVDQARDIIAKSIAAEDIWQQRIQEAIAENRRVAGLERVSDEDWRRAAREKGARRIGPGMSASRDKFRSKISGVINELRAIDLPPRTADVSANIERVRIIAERLHAKKGEF